MSADDYFQCPVCKGQPEDLRKGYKQYYGKVAEEEYDKMKQDYSHNETDLTVPVYYEVSLNEDGTVSLDLGGECNLCHAKWEFKGVVK